MFNFGKKKDNEDPQKALDNARNSVNKGITGGLTKAFMGQGFVDKMNNAMDQGQAALNGIEQQQWLALHGADADAEVVSVQDTGATVNMNPVVLLQLKVTPATEAPFDIMAQSMVSRIAVPRKGDKVKIKYNPADHSQILVLG